MGLRLYDSALIRIEGEPQRVHKDARNAGIFRAGGYVYSIDGVSYNKGEPAPQIMALLTIQEIREAGLSLGSF
jgi:hypothetical protein